MSPNPYTILQLKSFLFQESKSSEAEEEVTEAKDEEPGSPKAEEDLATGIGKELEKLSVKPSGDE